MGGLFCFTLSMCQIDQCQNQIEQSQHNSGLLWKTVNDIIKLKKTKSSHHIRLKDENKNLIENPVHVSNIFNKYFSSIGTNMAKKISLSKKH